MTDEKNLISAVILTYNEEKNIPACLESLTPLSAEIFVVDSGSGDGTVLIAKKYTSKIYTHPFETHAKQWNWALQNLPVSGEWVLALDADQRLTPELAKEIQEMLENPPNGIGGFYLPRRQIFRGQWIRYGGYYPKYLLKLFKQGKVRCDENELLDFRFYVKGNTTKLRSDLIEDNLNEKDLRFWTAKHTRFAKLQAQEELLRRRNGVGWSIQPSLFGTPDQRTLWMKQLWYRLPLFLRPFLYFFYRYFIRLGFLDGTQGLIFHFYQGFWYRMLVDINLYKLRKASAHDPARR